MTFHIPNRAVYILFISVTTLLSGCTRDPAGNAPPAKETIQAPAQEKTGSPATWPVEVVDSLGRKVTVSRPPERTVSLAPSNTEILFAVGAGQLAVGRTSYDNYPPEARSRTAIGGMTPKSINLEALIALRPDLVLATSGIQEPIIASLERLKLVVVAIDATDFAGVAEHPVGRPPHRKLGKRRPARERIPGPRRGRGPAQSRRGVHRVRRFFIYSMKIP